MYQFGAGSLYGVPTTTGSTPAKFGGLQEVSFDFTFSVKELYGQYQFPLCVARGTAKVSAKAKQANIQALMFNQIFFGQTLTPAASKILAVDEPGTVPASVAYTVSVSNSTRWVTDLGVTYAATGLPLTAVTTPSAAGQYSVAAGVYTFNVADASAAVLISYTYTATTGNTITIQNQLIGVTPYFSSAFQTKDPRTGKNLSFVFNSCTSSKITLATKLEDFIIPEFDFSIFADASGTIGYLYSGE